MVLDIDFAEAEKFLTLLSDGEPLTFQTFDDAKGAFDGKAIGYKKPAWHGTGTFDELKGQLAAANHQGHGVYVMVNRGDGQGRSTENVTAVRALFADLDGAPLQPVLDCPVEPHAIVESSPGKYQVFYLMDGCPLGRFESLQLALARKFAGDPSVADLPRVMRIPGFYHRKAVPFLTRIVRLEAFLPYPVDEFVREMDLAGAEAEEAKKRSEPLPKLESIPVRSIQEGGRHDYLVRNAVKFAHANLSHAEVLIRVQGLNHTLLVEPKPFDEVVKIVEYAMKVSGPRVDLSKLLADDAPTESILPADESVAVPLALPVSLVTAAPGLVGYLAEWVAASVSRYQPHFALAAALAFVGALKGHRVQSPRRYRTNHMAVAIGKSGSGKSEVGNRIDDVIRLAGLDALACGIPASDAALRVTLSRHGGRVYLFWDEMGLALENMLNRNAPTHMKAVKDILIEVSTKAAGVLRRKERAYEDKDQAKYEDVEQPCFGLYGTAQPDVFYGALSSAHASDGFFPRLLVFETGDNYPPERKITHAPPPEELLDACRQVEQEWPTNTNPRGNLDKAVVPRVVPFTPAAERVLETVKADVERRLAAASEASGGIWARVMSHVEKIALTVEDTHEVHRESVEWAAELMLQLAPAMASAFAMRVSDSAVEKLKKKVFAAIVRAGKRGLAQNELTRATQWLRDKRERDTILAELMEAGQIEVIESSSEGRGRPSKVWRSRASHTPRISSNFVNSSVDPESPVKSVT